MFSVVVCFILSGIFYFVGFTANVDESIFRQNVQTLYFLMGTISLIGGFICLKLKKITETQKEIEAYSELINKKLSSIDNKTGKTPEQIKEKHISEIKELQKRELANEDDLKYQPWICENCGNPNPVLNEKCLNCGSPKIKA